MRLNFDGDERDVDGLAYGQEQWDEYLGSGKLVEGHGGSVGYAMSNTDMIQLKPIKRQLVDFKFMVYYRPNGIIETQQRVLTVTNGNRVKLFAYLDPVDGDDDVNFVVDFGKFKITCNPDLKMNPSGFNELTIEFKALELTCCVREGACDRISYQDTDYEAEAIDFTMDKWWIGHLAGGLDGTVDRVEAHMNFGSEIDGIHSKLLFHVVFVGFVVMLTGILCWKNQLECCNPCGDKGHSRQVTKRPTKKTPSTKEMTPARNLYSGSSEGVMATRPKVPPQPKPTAPVFKNSPKPPPRPGNAPRPPPRKLPPKKTPAKTGLPAKKFGLPKKPAAKKGKFGFKKNKTKKNSGRLPRPPMIDLTK